MTMQAVTARPGMTQMEAGGRVGLKPGRGRRTCAINLCSDLVRARGWCNKHYARWKKYGDPLGHASCDPTIRYEGPRRLYAVVCPRCGATREVTGVGVSREKQCPSCACGGPIPLREKAWLVDAYSRWSSGEIAKRLGCSGQTVLDWLRRHDIPVRSRHEAQQFRHEGTRRKVTIGRNRQMVTGNISDRRPGSVRHVEAPR